MPIAIVVVAYLCLGIHSYLNYFWVKKTLPYMFYFYFVLRVEWLLILINTIYLLGWLWGFLTFTVALFGIVFFTFPLSFLCHCLAGQSEMEKMLVGERPSLLLYGGWSLLVLTLAVLTGINFFITPYGDGLNLISGFSKSLDIAVLAWVGGLLGLLVYLLIGLTIVVKDYSAPRPLRPFYVMRRNIMITVFIIFFWPVPLIDRKAIERSLRRRQRRKSEQEHPS
jgi:hypothetical protein